MMVLPNEVIGHIFDLYADAEHPRVVLPSQHAAPLLLAQLSRRCRQVAFETSQLWCSVEKSYGGSQPETWCAEDPMLILWLQRAHGRPLHVVLHQIAQPLLLSLLYHFPNIASLQAHCARPNGSAQPSHPDAKASCMRSLTLSETGPGSPVLDHSDIVLSNLQRLAVDLILPRAIYDLIQRSMLGNILHHLDFYYPGTTPRSLRRILRIVPALTHLTLHENYSYLPEEKLPSAIRALVPEDILPHLESLEVHSQLRPNDYPVFMTIIRRRLGSGLKTARLHLHHECSDILHSSWPDYASEMDMRKLVIEGADFRIIKSTSARAWPPEGGH